MYEHAYLDRSDAQSCRAVCSKWNKGIDHYFQTNDFHSMENIYGATNYSDMVLKMPLRLIEFDRLHQMNLHPRCVSYGKKLTLKLDAGGCGRSAQHVHHRRELLDLVQNVSKLWNNFEHLEIACGDQRHYVPQHPDIYNEGEPIPIIRVPYGDLGVPEVIQTINTWMNTEPPPHFFSYFHPDQFEMLIPFLHHLTNLKTVTFNIYNAAVIANILLRIPNTGQLEKVFILSEGVGMISRWPDFLPLAYSKWNSTLSSLSGCPAVALYNFFVISPEAENVFPNLIELSVTILTRADTCAIQRLTEKMQRQPSRLCPSLVMLQIQLLSSRNDSDVLDDLYPFAAEFGSIRHFCLSGHCVPSNCASKRQIRHHGKLGFKLASSELDINDKKSSVTTFQIECSSHVPICLMRDFTNLNKVIVAEYCCEKQKRTSRSKDGIYVRGLFALLDPNIRMVTFYGEKKQARLLKPGVITCFRSDSDKLQQHNRERELQNE